MTETQPNASQPGSLVIISGPSGAGKSTVVKRLFEVCPLPLQLSVSATTRSPRKGEKDGVDYHFLSKDEFTRRREAGEFLEFMEVFSRGDWYGTLAAEVASGLEAGKWVVLEIDVQGAMSVVEKRPDAITVFIHPGSMEELERRLRTRGTDTDDAIARRLEVASREMNMKDKYRFEVVNKEIDQAAQDISDLLITSGAQ